MTAQDHTARSGQIWDGSLVPGAGISLFLQDSPQPEKRALLLAVSELGGARENRVPLFSLKGK